MASRYEALHVNEEQVDDQCINMNRLFIDHGNYHLLTRHDVAWPFTRNTALADFGSYNFAQTTMRNYVRVTNWRRAKRMQHELQMHANHFYWRFDDLFYPADRIRDAAKVGKAITKVAAGKTIAARFAAYAEAFPTIIESWRPATNHNIMYNLFTRAKASSPLWRLRGLVRYSSLPWKNESWWCNSPFSVLHGTRLSKKHEGLLAYYQNADKFERDIMTPIKAGRYLAQFFSHVLDGEQIKYWATRFANECAPSKLFFTDYCTKDNRAEVERQWLDIYATGPGSCMKGSSSVKVYVYPDNTLRLAYFTNNNMPKSSDNYAIARCITRSDAMEWVRIYPEDEGTMWNGMKNALEALDYDHGDLNGAKGQLIERNGSIVCPYVDRGNNGDQNISVHHSVAGLHYIKFGGGEYDACNTNGFADDNRAECSCCGEREDDDDMRTDNNGDYICESCFEEHYVDAIGRHGDRVVTHNDNAVYVESQDDYYHERWLSHNNIYVAQCGRSEGEYFHEDDLVTTPGGFCSFNDAVELDVDTSCGCHYVAEGDEEVTHDGRTIAEIETEEIDWWDGETYLLHDNDEPEDYLPHNPADDLDEDAMSPFTYPNATTVASIYN